MTDQPADEPQPHIFVWPPGKPYPANAVDGMRSMIREDDDTFTYTPHTPEEYQERLKQFLAVGQEGRDLCD